MGDRATQIIASIVCVAALAVAGLLQPRLTEMASEQYIPVSYTHLTLPTNREV